MHIINPIYDSAFKYLMDNNQVAKLIISAIIGEEVEDATGLKVAIPLKKGETGKVQSSFFTLLRIDFAARIRTAEGKYKEVLIEIQKAKFSTDIMHFHRYLDERYVNENVCIELNGQKKALPILPIYFLGHSLEHCDATVLKINREYIDMITGSNVTTDEEFIESLTHNCFVIQITKLKQRRRNDLEALLSIFDQDNLTTDRHILNIREEEIPEKYRPVLRRLLEAISEKAIRNAMKAEDEVLDELQTLERKVIKQEQQIAEERRLKEEECRQKEEALQKEKEAKSSLKLLIQGLIASGKTVAEIAEMLNKTVKEVESLLE
jgi:DNA-binding NarL/FixJ family response regulator